MEKQPSLCLICAWRENCIKKSKRDIFMCPDFTKDIRIKDEKKDEKNE